MNIRRPFYAAFIPNQKEALEKPGTNKPFVLFSPAFIRS
jgi:hypothetical protein